LMKDLRTLGFVDEGGVDPHFHTRVRTINIQRVLGGVTNSPDRGDKHESQQVTNSQADGDKLTDRGDKLTGRGDKLEIQSALPSYNRPKTVPLTVAPENVFFDSVVSGSEYPTTNTTTKDPSGKTTSIPDIQKESAVGVKASELAKTLIINPTTYSDPFVASDRGKAVRAAREDDHVFAVGETCACCRIKLTTPDRPFCRECDNECECSSGKCHMQDIFLALHRYGGDWRNSVFAPFNEKRLVEVAGRVVTHAVRVALNSTPKNAATNLDRVLQLLEHRMTLTSRLKPTAGVVAALEDLHTTALVVARHCENLAGNGGRL
jgi:hypothetical protein